MERYGKFYGCDKTGRYETLLYARELDMLMARCGAKNPGAAVDAAINPLCAFQLFPQYSDNKQDEYPVSLCYIPRHLSKLDAFREMNEPVYAVAVNGFEHKARDTNYSCAALISRQEMLSEGPFNYLDQIFGTPLVSWQDMYLLREKGQKPDVNMTPAKVTPVLKNADQAVICAVVDAIYADKKHIYICLEQGRTFNKRSVDLLTQIYSLLPPRLAIETGFVTYQPVNKVQELIATTGIKISVYPAEAASNLPAETESTVVMDLNRPETVRVNPKSKVVKGVQWWANLGWDQRREAMAKLFADRNTFLLDVEKYVEITASFAQNDLLTGKLKNAAFPDVDSIQKVYESDPVLSKGITWITTEFLKLLKAKGRNVAALKGEVIAQAKVAELQKNKELLQKYSGQYEFLSKLQAGDSSVAALQSIVDPVMRIQREQDQGLIAAAEAEAAQKTQELAAANTAHAAEVAKLNSDHDAAMTQAKDAHNQQMVALTQKCGAQIDELKQTHEAKVAAMAQQHTEEVTNLTTAKDAAERNLVNAQNQILSERQAHETAMATTLEEARKAQAQAVFNAKATLREELEAQHQQEKNQIEAHYSAEIRNQANSYEAKLEQERQNAAAAQRTATVLQRKVEALSTAAGEGGMNGNVYEDTDDTDNGSDTGRSRTGGGRFDRDKDKKNNNALIMVAAICGVVGLILGILIMVAVNALTGGGETTPTTDPIVTTTAPVETTEPVETTQPVETTVPEETTAPVETTVPEETTEPTEPGEVAKPEIDWTAVPDQTGLTAVETDETNVGNLLNHVVLGQDVKAVAIVTVEETGFMDANGVRVRPSEYAVLLEKTGLEAEAETDAQVKKLEDAADLIIEGTHYRLVVVGEAKMQEAALKLFALAVPAEDPEVSLSMVLADQAVLKLDKLLDEVITGEPWWSVITDVSVEETALLSGKALLSSRLSPVAAINCGMNSTVYIYDYTSQEEMDKAGDFVDLQVGKSRVAAAVDYMVAVVYQIAQG